VPHRLFRTLTHLTAHKNSPMTLVILLACSLALFALAWLTRHDWSLRGRTAVAAPGGAAVDTLRQQLEQLRRLNQSGALDDVQHAEARQDLERRIVDAVVNPPSSENGPRQATPQLASRLLMLAGIVSLVAAAGSVMFDNAQVVAPETDVPAATSASAPDNGHALTSGQIDAMLDKLATRLKENPADADGWAMLGRSYAVLGRHADSLPALKKAVELRPKDATLLADYADALAVSNGQSLEGEPSQLIERALALDPNHLKALALAGTAAFNRKDYAGALRHWDKLARLAPASEAVRQVQGGIDEARRLAASAAPAAAGKSSAARAAPASAAAVASAGKSISGTVSLAPALLARTRPDDTLFVYARAAEGSRMPLAILKKQVKDLPLAFTLDDSQAMSPTATLSTAPRVVVGARVSRSGNAAPQAGDLQGLSTPMAPSATGLKIQINEVVAGP
jgi:cytochrome c-type biogenesis protein CcmH